MSRRVNRRPLDGVVVCGSGGCVRTPGEWGSPLSASRSKKLSAGNKRILFHIEWDLRTNRQKIRERLPQTKHNSHIRIAEPMLTTAQTATTISQQTVDGLQQHEGRHRNFDVLVLPGIGSRAISSGFSRFDNSRLSWSATSSSSSSRSFLRPPLSALR